MYKMGKKEIVLRKLQTDCKLSRFLISYMYLLDINKLLISIS